MNCRGCGKLVGKVVFQMDPMPLAGGFASSQAEALNAAKLPLTWIRCDHCELVQVAEDVPDEMLYRNYCYASSTIKALRDHFEDYAHFLMEGVEESLRVLEIGCNDGILLRQLPANWELVGVDPSDVAVQADPQGHYILINEPFTVALELQDFDMVLASNCLAHITDIQGTVAAVAQALRPGGLFWVEVHDLEATLKTGQWDTVYHEHKAEYNLASLCHTIEPHGFRLEITEKLPLHGGLIRAGFRKTDKPEPSSVLNACDYSFRLLTETYRGRRENALYTLLRTREPIAYGASGRATVWFNQLPELEFRAVIDDSLLRQGKFVPGVGWPIVSWDDRPEGDCTVITAWNYASVIRAQHPEYSGMWLQTWGV